MNPLAGELKSSTAKLAALRRARDSLAADLDWYARFDVNRTKKVAVRQRQTLAELEQSLAAISQGLTKARARTPKLVEKTKLGWDPTYWFSKSRDSAKSRLAQHHKFLSKLEKQAKDVDRKVRTAKKKLRSLDGDLRKYATFDPDDAQTTLTQIDSEISLRELEHEELAERKARVDRALKEPLKELRRFKSDLEDLRSEATRLEYDIDKLQREVRDAERIDERMSRAATGYERAMLHQECSDAFGFSSPREVVRDRRRSINQARSELQRKRSHMASTERSISKVEARIAQVGERTSRRIGALVIDGNNLCYQGGQFIGLVALKTLCQRLQNAYDVTVVFDASIRRALGKNDSDLRTALPGVTVHVMSSRGQADETVLQIAQDPVVYVLSNDRYAEYRDKAVVKDHRLIRHEIVNGRVLVHDLSIDEPFFNRN